MIILHNEKIYLKEISYNLYVDLSVDSCSLMHGITFREQK